MYVAVEMDSFWTLKNNSWSGAIDTLNDIENADLEDEFMDLMEMVFENDTPTETELNDWIWFDRDFIYEKLGLDENGQLPSDNEGDEDNE